MRFFKNADNVNGDVDAKIPSKKQKENKKFGNIWAKVICVLAAMLVWFYASGEQSSTYEKNFYNIDVQYAGLSSLEGQGYTLITGKNATVDITVSGKRSDVNNIGKNDIVVSADVSGIYAPGEYTLSLEVETPGNTSAKDTTPDTVVVYVDKSSQREIPVVPRITTGGTTELDIKIEELIPAYSMVRVTGPDEELSKISYAAIDVALDRLVDSSVEYTGKIYLVDKNNEKYSNAYVKTDKTEIKVTVPVNKYKTVPVEVAYSGSSAEELGHEVTLSLKNVEIRGNVDIIDGIGVLKTESIDLDSITGNTSIVAELAVPPGAEIVGDTDTVTVSVVPHSSNSASITTSNIVIINVPEGFSARLEEKSQTFTFIGSAVAVSRLNSKNIYAVADLSAYKAKGTYDVKLSVQYPESSGAKLKEEYYCKITLYK